MKSVLTIYQVKMCFKFSFLQSIKWYYKFKYFADYTDDADGLHGIV